LRWREASAELATVSRRRGGIGRSTLLIWPKEHRLVRGLPQFADPKSRAPQTAGCVTDLRGADNLRGCTNRQRRNHIASPRDQNPDR
jgi:hypothetical protein